MSYASRRWEKTRVLLRLRGDGTARREASQPLQRQDAPDETGGSPTAPQEPLARDELAAALGRIREIIDIHQNDPLARVLLTNAIHFQSQWLRPFEQFFTRPEPFRLLDGSSIKFRR